MRASALILLLTSLTAGADELTKVFSDQGKTYVRCDNPTTMVLGTELPMFSDAAGTKAAGKAVVMEVTGQLLRLSVDEDAVKASAKFVRLVKPLPPPPLPPLVPIPVKTPAPAAAAVAEPLKGKLDVKDNGVVVRNNSERVWTDCQLRYSDRRHASVDDVQPHDSSWVPEKKVQDAPDLVNDRITVRCAEGDAVFFFDQPARKNVLQGYAENRRGKIYLHNESPIDWSQCDLIKPDGTHYVEGRISAHSEDSIRASLFKPPAVETVTLTCAQGSLTSDLP